MPGALVSGYPGDGPSSREKPCISTLREAFRSKVSGRIMKEQHGPSAGSWSWTCFDGGAQGRADTKGEAVAAVEIAYTRRIVGSDLAR